MNGISYNFKREVIIMASPFVAVIFLGVLAAWLLPKVMDSPAEARCLDSGGAFNQKTQSCEHMEHEKR
jgi:hypothetical protein